VMDSNGKVTDQQHPADPNTTWSAYMATNSSFGISGLTAEQQVAQQKAEGQNQEHLNVQQHGAEDQQDIAKENAVNKTKAGLDAKPVYALNSNGDTVLTTSAQANAAGMTALRPVKEADISKDQHDISVLNDISTKAQAVRNAAGAMDQQSWYQAATAAKYLADNPNTTLNSLLNSKLMKGASPQTTNYVIAVNSLRESAMGLNKVLTGSARNSETQIHALQATLPGVEPNSAIVNQKLNAFTQNLNILAKPLPKGTGVEYNGGQQQAPQRPNGVPANFTWNQQANGGKGLWLPPQ
jgi:hypothetical protein